MGSTILDGLSRVDATGHLILAATLTTLALGIGVNLPRRRRHERLRRDLEDNGPPHRRLPSSLLNDIVPEADEAARNTAEPHAQAIVEDRFQADLKGLLLAERFVRAATGLVIILGLLGTFYGLTLSIGKLVQLVAGDSGGIADVAQAMTGGLTDALSG